MTAIDLVFTDARVRRVSDGAYFPVALDLIRSARYRCLCSMFIIDHGLDGASFPDVDRLMVELSAASWRGVDTRLVVGGSRENARIRGAALLASARARALGIPVHLAAARRDSSSHLKLLLVDDSVLTGSHNWAAGMLGGQIQDSVLVESPTVAEVLTDVFETQWTDTTGETFDVSV